VRVIDDMGFPAGGPRTMTADLTGKLPQGTQKIRITTNLQIYWDSILVSRTAQDVAPPSRRLVKARDDASEGQTPSGRRQVLAGALPLHICPSRRFRWFAPISASTDFR
jgi:hypothetical protein